MKELIYLIISTLVTAKAWLVSVALRNSELVKAYRPAQIGNSNSFGSSGQCSANFGVGKSVFNINKLGGKNESFFETFPAEGGALFCLFDHFLSHQQSLPGLFKSKFGGD